MGDNIKVDLLGMGWGKDWIDLAQLRMTGAGLL